MAGNNSNNSSNIPENPTAAFSADHQVLYYDSARRQVTCGLPGQHAPSSTGMFGPGFTQPVDNSALNHQLSMLRNPSTYHPTHFGLSCTGGGGSVVLGENASGNNDRTVSIGSGSLSSGWLSAALSALSTANGHYAIACGAQSSASGGSSIAIGGNYYPDVGAQATADRAISIGAGSTADQNLAVVVGAQSKGNGDGATVVGSLSQGLGVRSVILGASNVADAHGICLGTNGHAGDNAIVINADGNPLQSLQSGLYIRPIRMAASGPPSGAMALHYDTLACEVFSAPIPKIQERGSALYIGENTDLPVGSNPLDYLDYPGAPTMSFTLSKERRVRVSYTAYFDFRGEPTKPEGYHTVNIDLIVDGQIFGGMAHGYIFKTGLIGNPYGGGPGIEVKNVHVDLPAGVHTVSLKYSRWQVDFPAAVLQWSIVLQADWLAYDSETGEQGATMSADGTIQPKSW